MLLFTAFSFIANAQSGANDPTFNSGTGAVGDVWTSAIRNDGKIIIGGYSTSYNGTAIHRIARLNADGTLDGTFNPSTGASGLVRTTAIQSDGKIIIGGEFTSYDGTASNRIARLNTVGTLDGTFNIGTGAGDWVYIIAIQSDGKIIIGGNFGIYNGTSRNKIARLNTNGSLDGTFTGTGANDYVWTIAIQSNGKIIIGGNFGTYNGTSRNKIARLNADGSLDGTFIPGTGANDPVFTTAIQNNGKIIIGGWFTSYNGTVINRIARLNADGSLDGTFNPGTGANQVVRTTAIQSDGKIIIGGDFTSYNGTAINHIARLNTDGSLDGTFNPGAGANDIVRTTAIQSDGKIIIGGEFTSYDGTTRNRIARLNGVSGGVGINDGNIDPRYFSTYPNPSNGIFQLTVDNMQSAKGELEIYNLFGEKVYTASNIQPPMQIDLSTLSKGIYFVKVNSGEKIYSKKIFVQ